jgi:hypothetical protein
MFGLTKTQTLWVTIALLFLIVGYQIRQAKAEESRVEKALKAHVDASLNLLERETPENSDRVEILRRRLDEVFCMKISRCREVSTSFGECLRETREY